MNRNCQQSDEIISVTERKRRSLHELPVTPKCPVPLESPKLHVSPMFPGSPWFLVSPVSNRRKVDTALKAYAAVNACTERNTARTRRWNFVRDLRGLETR